MNKKSAISAALATSTSLVLLLSGCSGERTLKCAEVGRYVVSQSTAPVRVPEGLNVPSETEALRIPSGEPLQIPDLDTTTECLESPPDFFDEEETEN